MRAEQARQTSAGEKATVTMAGRLAMATNSVVTDTAEARNQMMQDNKRNESGLKPLPTGPISEGPAR